MFACSTPFLKGDLFAIAYIYYMNSFGGADSSILVSLYSEAPHIIKILAVMIT